MLAHYGLGDTIADAMRIDRVSHDTSPTVVTNANTSVPGSAPAIGYGYPGIVPLPTFLSNSQQNVVYASPLDVNSIQSQLAALQSDVTSRGYGNSNNFLNTVETFIQNNPMLSVGIGGVAAYVLFKSGRR